MEFSFKDKKLRELCEGRGVAERKLGAPCARKLRARLADLEAAGSVSGLPAGRPHALSGDREGQFSVALEGGMRLVFEPNHNPTPLRDDGGIDWPRVTRVRIIFVGDYHD
jgi:proteic killer suppression protein